MALNMMQQRSQQLGNSRLGAQRAGVPKPSRVVVAATPKQAGRWKSIDAGVDMSDDQQDIQRARGMTDDLFQGFGGTMGTNNAILSSQDYISQARTSFNNIEDGYYISPSFLDKMTVHVAKNFMDLPKIKVPLILGIWGGKGQGKTFQCALAYKKLGIAPIVMSAGELESGNAGEPAKLLRQRYREASDIVKKGKMCSLFINDLDAGAGRMGEGTQYTVNNQMVNATLMNIADNPTNVQLPGMYNTEDIPRVPIIATGNDFSTLYAPLIRDGRMEKFYWNPTREDRIGVCMGIFMDDDVNRADVEQLVDSFPGQSIDFFGALRSRVYDDMVRNFISDIGLENMGKRLINSREGKVAFDKPSMTIDLLMEFGQMVVAEQENVKRVQLADAYLGGAELAGASGTSMPEEIAGEAAYSWDAPSNGRTASPRRPLDVSPAVQEAIAQQQQVRGTSSPPRQASPPPRYSSPPAGRAASPPPSSYSPPPAAGRQASSNGASANTIEDLAAVISAKYMGMGKTAMDALPELRRQGVVCQGPNQFAVKGKVVDTAGVATALRLTPRR